MKKVRIANVDKFSRAILLILLILALIYNIKLLNEREKTNEKVESLEETQDSIKEAYDLARDELDELKEEEIPKIHEELELKNKELDEKKALIEKKEKEITQLQNKVSKVNRGSTRDMASRGGSRKRIKEVYFEVTMYTNEQGAFPKGSPNYGKTTSGEFTKWGFVAAPREIPFGTKIQLLETKEGWENLLDMQFEVKDRGGKITKKLKDGLEVYCIDIYNPDLQGALNWGRQLVKGYIIEN